MYRIKVCGMLVLGLALSCWAGMASVARADPLLDAEAAYDQKDFATALRIVQPLADAGNTDAQFLYGRMYQFGNGAPQNLRVAASWFQKASDAGHAESQCGLAELYLSERAFADRQTEGALLARRGAEKGLPACQIQLGFAYALARGRPRDWLIGHVWMNIAAANPNARKSIVSTAQEMRRITEKVLTSQQLADAQLFADEWHRGTASTPVGTTKVGHARNLEVQRLLELLGYDAGQADGVIGAATRTAIATFLKKMDKPRGEQVDDELAIMLHRAWAAAGETSRKGNVAARREIDGTGTGFFVSKQGHVLTNNHVVRACTSIQLRWPDGREKEARLIGRSIDDDLAVLKTDGAPTEIAAFRPNGQARLGETVVVYGFPLPSLLSSSGNLTTGAVTALAGLRDESRIMQISAPVQTGNSGGPVLDQNGRVVGIIVSKIDVLAVAKKTSDVPQNVNFAIKGSVGTNFLDSKDVEYDFAPEREAMPMEEIVRRVKRFTVQVACAG